MNVAKLTKSAKKRMRRRKAEDDRNMSAGAQMCDDDSHFECV